MGSMLQCTTLQPSLSPSKRSMGKPRQAIKQLCPAQLHAAVLGCFAMLAFLWGVQQASAANPLAPNAAVADAINAIVQPRVRDAVLQAAVLKGVATEASVRMLTDIDILNFALNLEYLAANFWSFAAFGHGLPIHLRGGGPPAVGGHKALLGPEAQKIAEEVAYDEISHVNFLRATLGPLAVPQPLIDLGAISVFVGEALHWPLMPPFNPWMSSINTFIAGFTLSDIEPSAYRGAISLLKHTQFVSATAGLLGTESFHAGVLRLYLLQHFAQPVQPYGPLFPAARFCQAISDQRDLVDGPINDDQSIFIAGMPNLVPTDANALVFSRTPGQILSIVYNGHIRSGGFFPAGVNGRIREAATFTGK